MPATEIDIEPTAASNAPAQRAWSWYVFTFIVCAHFGLSYVGRNRYFLDLHRYTDGKLGVPFQYRTLVAWIFRALVSNHFFSAIAAHAPKNYADPYRLAYLVVTIPALLGCVFATGSTIYRLTGDADFSRWSSLLVVYMAYFNLLLTYGLTYTLPYDVPSLFFFCIGINLVVRQKYWLYYLLFVPAVLNRETICFLTVFFAVWEWFRLDGNPSRKLQRILPHVVVQLAMWVAIKLYLFKLYAHNPSEIAVNRVFGNEFVYNLKEMVLPTQWPLLLSNFGFTLPLLIGQRRWIGSKAMAWECAILLPLWLCGMMWVGVVLEVRIFTELISIMAPAIALILYNRYWRVFKNLAASTVEGAGYVEVSSRAAPLPGSQASRFLR
jgi:hypothetical protein